VVDSALLSKFRAFQWIHRSEGMASFDATTACASGCMSQLRGFQSCLAGLQKLSNQPPQLEVLPEASTAEVPLCAAPALFSQSGLASREEVPASISDELPAPTLLTAQVCTAASDAPRKEEEKKEVDEVCAAPPDAPCGEEKKQADEDSEVADSSTAVPTEGSSLSTPRSRLECCAASPSLPQWDAEDFFNLSARMSQVAWHGGKEAAFFVAGQLQRVAELAEPHVSALADSAVDAIKSAAQGTLTKRPAPETRSRSTWEATSQRALTNPRSSVPPAFPELADFDTCHSVGGSLAPAPTRKDVPMQPRMMCSARSFSHAQPGSFDISRDAQLKYSLPGSHPRSQSFAAPVSQSMAGPAVRAQPVSFHPQRFATQMMPPTALVAPSVRLPAQLPRPKPQPEGPLVTAGSLRSDGLMLALAPIPPADGTGACELRPLDRNRVKSEA